MLAERLRSFVPGRADFREFLSFRSLEWQENEELSTGGKAGKKWRKSAKK